MAATKSNYSQLPAEYVVKREQCGDGHYFCTFYWL